MERGGVAGTDEDAGADDAADAEERQVPRAQRPLELAGPGFFLNHRDALAQDPMRPSKPYDVVRHSPFDLPSNIDFSGKP